MENTTDTAMDFFMANRSLSTFQMMVAYANSVRPEVVVPSEEWINGFKEEGRVASNMTISKLKSINPTMTFTELNHEK